MEDYKNKYEDLLDTIKDLYPNMTEYQQEKLQGVCPELTESEDDKIRKELIGHLTECRNNTRSEVMIGEYAKWIAWLEKQGEQKHIVPKFRIGDTIIPKPNLGLENISFTITKVEDDTYFDGDNSILVCNQDDFELVEQKPVEMKWNELTWQDIITLEEIINYVHYEFRNGIGQESFGKEVLERFSETKGDEYLENTEKKVEWSEEDENAIEVIQDIIRHSNKIDANVYTDEVKEKLFDWIKSLKPQPKQEWSEDMGKLTLDAVSLLKDYSEGVKQDSQLGQKMQKAIAFLTDLYHEAFYPKTYNMREDLKLVEWGEEDEKNLKECIIAISRSEGHTLEEKEQLEKWLNNKKHKDTTELEMKRHNEGYVKGVHDAYDNVNQARSILKQLHKERPKQAWSKEDEKILSAVIDMVTYCYVNQFAVDVKTSDKARNWLRSLKDKVPPQEKVEWSEEDEKFINELCDLFASIAKEGYVGRYYAPNLVCRLKSLKPNHWKPSETQTAGWKEKLVEEAKGYLEKYAETINGDYSKMAVLSVAERLESLTTMPKNIETNQIAD